VNESALEQVIVFTSFDSGQWYFPAIPVVVTDGNGRATLYSDSFLVKVGYSPADSSGQLRDIKEVMDVHIIDYTIYYIIAGILLFLLLAWLFYRWWKKREKRPAPILNSNLSAYQEAMQALDTLEKNNYLNTHNEKTYHTELAGIFKRYLSRHNQKHLLNKTTGDILIELKEMNTDTGDIGVVAEALRYTDAVKFAKFILLHSESAHALSLVRKSIESIEKKTVKTT